MDTHNDYSFISSIVYNDVKYYGLIKIQSPQFTSLYCLNDMPPELQEEIISLGNNWWWHSNRIIPISLFSRVEMLKFEPYVKRFITSNIQESSGPMISLNEIPYKKSNRKKIILKRKKT